ncbi:glutaredoxin domain-containing protein [Aquamicrobium zhengzhouense]|uniref:Glutaredoxin n=1 Tax=Aquamicrobium zhengzhouense TaxID=2781738 RepID=A0ABS0S9U4_9HYPH|nr:glutaredoxin [Aquamicrobium zhengzhouense]MBI1620058.1 glutaredoxin [Aquamicrobium zhengzhouense]
MQKQPLSYLVIGTADCRYCVAAKNLLNECKLAYDEEVITMAEAKERGYETVPQIFYGPNYVGGYTELHARLSKTHMLF